MGVAYQSDLSAALGIIRDLVQANERVLKDPKPVIQVVNLADSAIVIAVKPWVAVTDYGPVAGEINLSLVEELRKREISIPYPQREIRLAQRRGLKPLDRLDRPDQPFHVRKAPVSRVDEIRRAVVADPVPRVRSSAPRQQASLQSTPGDPHVDGASSRCMLRRATPLLRSRSAALVCGAR